MPTKNRTAYNRQWRLDNPDKHKASSARARKVQYLKNYTVLESIKTETPCSDCGVNYPHYVMEFDHRPGETKLASVATLCTSRTKMLAEISKCDIVCANCHATRTYARRMVEAD